MAEDVATYDQVQTGDPDPLGLDKRLAQVKSKGDPLGLDARLQSVKQLQQTPSSFQVQISKPEFKSSTAPTGARTFDYNVPTKDELGVEKLRNEAVKSQSILENEVASNTNAKANVVISRKFKKAAESPEAAMKVKQEYLTPQKEWEQGVTNEELNKIDEEAKSNRGTANAVIDAAMRINPEKSKELLKNLYKVDAFNSLVNDPNALDRTSKIRENLKALDRGDIQYDHHNQMLVKPEGFLSSLVNSRNELNNAFDTYDRWKTAPTASIINELNAGMKRDPDEPVSVPSGILGHVGSFIGGQPIKALVAGGIASAGVTALGNPEASGAAFNLASGAVSANDMYKIGKVNALKQNYALLKSQNPLMPDYTAYEKANEIAEKQAIADATTAGAMQFMGAKVGFGASKQLAKGLANGLSEVGDKLGKKAVESLGVGAIGGAGQYVKNKIAQANGLQVPSSEGVLDNFGQGVLLTGTMAMLGAAGDVLKPATKNKMIAGLAKVPDDAIDHTLSKLQESGHLSSEQIDNIKTTIKEQKALESAIPEDLPETDRLKMGAKIKERSLLKQQLEKVDEAFHPQIKENIKKLNEDIINISNGSERGDLQKLVHKEIKSGSVTGFAKDILLNSTESELKEHLKDIAEQAHDPNSAEETLNTFGENIVNKAKELYPKEESKESKISVIQTGEIKQPETITIAPKEEVTGFKTSKGSEYKIEGNKTTRNKAERPEHLGDSGLKEQSLATVYLSPDEANKADVIYTSGIKSRQINKVGNELHIIDELDNGQKKTTTVKFYTQPDIGLHPFEVFNDGNAHLGNQITELIKSGKQQEAGAGKLQPEQIGHVEVSEHGEDTKTAAKQENGTEPSKLSPDGVKEAQDLGQYLKEKGKTKIITSEVKRAQETANIAGKEADIPVETNPVLNTWNIGKYDGKPEGSFVEEAWANKPNEAPEGGESFNDFTKRMEQAYQFVKSLPEDNHVISHSKVMRALDALGKTDGKWTDETTKDFLTNKELPNATDVRGYQGQLPESGQTIGGSQETSGHDIQQIPTIPSERGEAEQQTGGRTIEEEGANKGQEKVESIPIEDAYGLPFIDEAGDKRTGIKNVVSKMTRFERKLPEVEVPKLSKDQEVLYEGKELVDSGKINPLDVVNRILTNKGGMEPDEAKAMQYYMHQLAQHETNLREQLGKAANEVEQSEINGQLQQLSDEIDAATEANIISGKAWSDVGNIRQIVADTGFNASREKAIIKDAYGGKIPEEVQKRLDKALKERDDALNRIAKLQEQKTQQDAAATIKKESVPKNPKKTSSDFKAERQQIKSDISDKLKKSRSGESGLTAVPLPFAKELIEITPEIFKLIRSYAEEGVQKTEEVINRLHDVLKDELNGITKADIVNLLAGRYKAEGDNVSAISQRIRDFRTEANLWTKIAEATRMEENTPQKKELKNKKLQDLKDRLNEIRTRNKEAVTEIKDILTSDAQKEVQRLQQRRKGLETQLRNKKYLTTEEKKAAPITNEILKEQQRIVNANYKIKTEKRKAFESQKNFYQKSLMWMGRAFRLSILSGYGVLGKLASAATIGGALKRIPEQSIGYIYGQAFKGISEKAPIEGYINAASEAKFYKEFFNPKTFAKNAWEILKTGSSPLSKKFGPGEYEHVPIMYLPTDLHQIIKDPLKRGTYEASLKNAMVWAEKNGLDINDNLVMQSLETAAYKRANYEIFQEQNWLSKKFNAWKSKMEQSGNIGATGKFLADFMIPVSTVPTNIARRVVTTSPLGLIRGGVKVMEAYRKGIESLTPEEADSVMKQLKQGTLGTAMWLIGWYGSSYFGGLYSKFNPNKSRLEGELSSDEMAIGGQMIPKPVQHALPLEVIQMAATARHVYDNYSERKGKGTPESIEKAGLASIGGLVEQIPVLETGAHAIGATTDTYEAKKLEEDVKRRFEPQILRETGIIPKKAEGGSSGGAGATGTIKRSISHTRKHN